MSIQALSRSLSLYIYIYIYIYIYSFRAYKGLILFSKTQNVSGSRLSNMHHTTIEETVANRAANEELFNDLMRLEAMLENIQNLNLPGKMNTLSHYYSLYFNH